MEDIQIHQAPDDGPETRKRKAVLASIGGP
jgi:hypothetical protein